MNKQAKLVAALRVNNEIAKRSQEDREKQAAAKSAVSALMPGVMDALLETERIYEHQRDQVQEKLAGDHTACLEFVRDLCRHKNSTEIGEIGTPVGRTKTANARATGAPVADQDDTLSGQAFRARLSGN